MKVGPTVRIVLLSGEASETAAGGFRVAGGVAAADPRLDAGVGLVSGRDIFLALSSVTMISPCC